MSDSQKTGLVLAAGGAGKRYGDPLPKQYHILQGKPLFMYSLESFLAFPEITKAVVVMPDSFMEEYGIFRVGSAEVITVPGGNERWESVRNGFNNLSGRVDNVIIHDAARPFVPAFIIRNCLKQVALGNNVITGIPVTDTIKKVNGDDVEHTLDRNKIISVQTPQAFPAQSLRDMYAYMEKNNFRASELLTDEGGLAEMCGLALSWIKGSPHTRKITDKDDFRWAIWMESQIRKGEVSLND